MTTLQKDLLKKYKVMTFLRFDQYIIELILGTETKLSKEIRLEAWKKFCVITDNREFASYPTIKKWFGIDGYAQPKRRQIFEIAFSLNLKGDEVNDMLTKGIMEPAIQVNDYQEAVYLYGLEQGLSWEECQQMIWQFHRNMEQDIRIRHSQSTTDLLREFQLKKNLSKDLFMEWLNANAEAFKGYSNTTLNYIKKYKRTIWKILKKEARGCLEEQLYNVDYLSWRKRQRFQKRSEGEWIRKYVYNNRSLPTQVRKELLDLASIVYFEKETNVRVLAEVFSNVETKRNSRSQSIRFMTEKYMSDLLNIATQKERDIRTMQLEVWLEGISAEEPCPEWMLEIVKECDVTLKYEKATVEEVRQWVSQYRKEHKRRLVQIDRSDLLPLVHYVAQNHYMESVENSGERYNKDKAQQYFIELADQTLSACCMARFSENYEMDFVLMSCFLEAECCSYADALDVIMKIK